MARGCALIDSRLDTAKIGSDGRVEVHRARLLAVFGGTKNVSTRPGSKPEKLHASICFPLFTQQRTSPRYFGMSVSCQLRTHAPQRAASLFDHFVGRHLNAESGLRLLLARIVG